MVGAIGTCGAALAMFGRLIKNPVADILLRGVLMLVALVALFYPDDRVSAAVAAIVLVATIFGVMRHRRIAPLKLQPAS